MISLSAEVRIYKELASQTGGRHAVILDDVHLKDLLSQHLDPPPSAAAVEASLIRMGFPSHAGRGESETGLGLCMCHLDVTGDDQARRISTAGYLCPQVGGHLVWLAIGVFVRLFQFPFICPFSSRLSPLS